MCRGVMGEEDRIDIQDQQVYRSLWEVLQGLVRNTVWTQSPADLQTPHGFMNLIRVG